MTFMNCFLSLSKQFNSKADMPPTELSWREQFVWVTELIIPVFCLLNNLCVSKTWSNPFLYHCLMLFSLHSINCSPTSRSFHFAFVQNCSSEMFNSKLLVIANKIFVIYYRADIRQTLFSYEL